MTAMNRATWLHTPGLLAMAWDLPSSLVELEIPFERESVMWELDGNKKKEHPVNDEALTFLGRGVNFKGVFSFDGTVRIDGRLEGEIHTKGTLMVGEQAMIKGTISAGTLISNGKINGTVTAHEKVQLLKSAVLVGEVHTPSLSVEEGAHIHGTCDMGTGPWADDDLPDSGAVHDLTEHRNKVRALLEHHSEE